MSVPVKYFVALVLRNPDDPSKVLAVLRPDDDPELPGVWGLPAGSLRPGEGPEETVARVALAKLGVNVQLAGVLASGEQPHQGYLLSMRLYEGQLQGQAPSLPAECDSLEEITYYTSWRWADPALLEEAARQGSLCCQLLLSTLSALSHGST